MDYAIFAIVIWIASTIILAVVSRKSIFKMFGIPANKYLRMDWRAYLVCMMMLGAAISIGITFLAEAVLG